MNKKRFPGGQKIEVRSEEDGFQGSWHAGTVIDVVDQNLHVKYDHIICDNDGESRPLVDVVDVSTSFESSGNSNQNKCNNHRGHIRPLPPPIKISKCDLLYGLCVDAYYMDAWWEGVIFDHENESDERKIFFPDLGDEITVGMDVLRITQDWDEVVENWNRRGSWLFLQVVHELEKVCPLFVSVKQIWYDVRAMANFDKIGEWTCNVKASWKELVSEVIGDHLNFFAEEFFKQGMCFAEPAIDFNLSTEVDLAIPNVVVVQDENPLNSEMIIDLDTDTTTSATRNDELSTNDSNMLLHDNAQSELSCSPDVVSNIEEPTLPKKCNVPAIWVPAGFDIIPRAEFLPDAIIEYHIASAAKKRVSNSIIMNTRMHLSYLGWKMECSRYKSIIKLRYISPAGKCYYSLRKVCQNLREHTTDIHSLTSPHDQRSSRSSPDVVLSSLSPEELEESGSESEDPDYCPQAVVSPRSNVINVVPEFCPQAVVDYYIHGLDKSLRGSKKKSVMKSKARKHLAAVGWVFWHKDKRGKLELRYNSPEGKCYSSLRQACKGFINGCSSKSIASTRRPVKTIHVRGEIAGRVESKKLSSKKSLGRKDAADGQPPHVLRSRKRARRQIIPSFSHRPQTVMSWLIDNNAVVPREKVYYRDRKDSHPKAEGRITGDGIKCCCCQKVFTLNSFGVHAGSKYRRAAANTFLKDGRSLLDCQNELVRYNKRRRCTTEPRDRIKHHRQDNICSACHNGGELVLCDQCPSSYHMSCLGLKDFPDGDWFCPSCCCRICGQSKFKDDSEHSVDGSLLNCDQCERKYHVECVRKTAGVNLENYPKENWFCSTKCEKISLSLRQLLGKPIPVGVDNLTWTLLKCTNSDSQDVDATDSEVLTENYSKLSVALSVMHECFEPLKEALTNRDIVEDVIFSRGSNLNRLNFRGFYTVLLEKNDEMITVATVRVYKEVAEIPLVATRNQFRRLGMCRTLMNELEKKLMELGVERLILPAVPSMLNTWTTSFGFSKMTDTERLQFLDHTFLDFQGTILCQKILKNIDLTQ